MKPWDDPKDSGKATEAKPPCVIGWCPKKATPGKTDELCPDHTRGWRETLAQAQAQAHREGYELSWIGVAILQARWADRLSRLGGLPTKLHDDH